MNSQGGYYSPRYFMSTSSRAGYKRTYKPLTKSKTMEQKFIEVHLSENVYLYKTIIVNTSQILFFYQIDNDEAYLKLSDNTYYQITIGSFNELQIVLSCNFGVTK